MNPHVLARAWESYRAKVLPPDAPDVQVVETRRAFYAGATIVLEICKRVGAPDVSEDLGVLQFEMLDREIVAFMARIGKDA